MSVKRIVNLANELEQEGDSRGGGEGVPIP
jgi:hypothetical protein